MRNYSELKELKTFKERFDYLKLDGSVGADTFGYDRWLNQKFYASPEWKRIRNMVIIRDEGYDLGHSDRPIGGRVLIHHMNPISTDDIIRHSDILMNPEYLICVSHDTHNAIHYGDYDQVKKELVERRPGDTKLW